MVAIYERRKEEEGEEEILTQTPYFYVLKH